MRYRQVNNLLLLIVLLASASVCTAQDDKRFGLVFGGRRLALVIGNKNYLWKPLINPENDARAVAKTLQQLGFQQTDIHLALNTTQPDLRRIVRQFLDLIKPSDLAFVYYSGHGVEVKGSNYILPVDLPADATEDYVEDEAVSAQRLLREMDQHGAKVRILILDACRDNPLRAVKSAAGGLAPMEGKGSLIVFSTEAGRTASDTPGSANSVFTKYLLDGLRQPGLPLDEAMKQVAKNVASETRERQVPAIYGLLLEDVILVKGSDLSSPSSADERAWQLVRNSSDVALLRKFVSEHPQSQFAKVAELKIAALGSPQVTSQIPNIGDTKVSGQDGQVYVWIPPGSFYMGCSPGIGFCRPDEKPSHNVSITKGFWMGQTPVTQAAWKRIMTTDPSHNKGGQLPVEYVNWEDSQKYCQAIGGRLPTEAEWEYAARAGGAGPGNEDLNAIAWYSKNSGQQTRPVATKDANAWKLFDMLGNVLEWTSDRYKEDYYRKQESTDPIGPTFNDVHQQSFPYDERVLRGGDWSKDSMSSSRRTHSFSSYASETIGFRCVQE